GRAHEQDKLSARERDADAAQRRDLPGSRAEMLDDVDGFDHRLLHRASTVTGSTRVTTTMAEIADTTLMVTVRPNSTKISSGVTTIGKAVSVVSRTSPRLAPAAMAKPMTAVSSACQRMVW